MLLFIVIRKEKVTYEQKVTKSFQNRKVLTKINQEQVGYYLSSIHYLRDHNPPIDKWSVLHVLHIYHTLSIWLQMVFTSNILLKTSV